MILAVSVAGCGPVAVSTSAAASTLPAGTSQQVLVSGGGQRTFLVHRPAGEPPQAGYPLVMMLHGGFGSGEQAEKAYGFDALADSEGFVVVYPDGLDRAWNAGGDCCGTPGREQVDDVGFLTAVIARVTELTRIDAHRRYLTGMSNGAMMTYRLACQTTIFAAIAPVAGTQLVDCPAARPVSVLHIHGDADTRVRLDGRRGEGVAHITGPPISSVLSGWRDRDGCAAQHTSTRSPVTTSIAECPQGRSVEWIVVAGAGHQWPGAAGSGTIGGDPPSEALSATSVIWDFFTRHPSP
jgi:polyhydroxybutyrate depolymerase